VAVPELLFGVVLVVALVGLAGYFAWRQFQTRRGLIGDRALTPEERGYLIRQTRRRLVCCVLMVLFAGFLVGWYFLEQKLPELQAVAEEEGKTHPLVELLAYYWILALLVLFGIFALAGLDFFATARYGLHQKKLLEIERRTALEIDAARLRQRRTEDRTNL
jgi:hypothetical protein